MPFSIEFGQSEVNGKLIDRSEASFAPSLFDENGNPIRSYIIFDPDAPSRNYIHQLVVNGKNIISYTPPAPPQGEIHHYVIVQFQGDPKKIPSKRAPFNDEAFFSKQNGIEPIDEEFFKSK